jgi:hypothetical protein
MQNQVLFPLHDVMVDGMFTRLVSGMEYSS